MEYTDHDLWTEYLRGVEDGKGEGYEDGYSKGYDAGYEDGFDEGRAL
jgi:flagellar biosynthesis/type III secretory pathway protein FliH